MKDIELLPTKYHKFPFRIANAVIRTDGNYCDCTITFELPSKNAPATKGIVGMQILSSNMQSLETMLQNIGNIYAPIKPRKVPVMKIDSVLNDRIGKLAFKANSECAKSPIEQ